MPRNHENVLPIRDSHVCQMVLCSRTQSQDETQVYSGTTLACADSLCLQRQNRLFIGLQTCSMLIFASCASVRAECSDGCSIEEAHLDCLDRPMMYVPYRPPTTLSLTLTVTCMIRTNNTLNNSSCIPTGHSYEHTHLRLRSS